jgi:hypothetical protein
VQKELFAQDCAQISAQIKRNEGEIADLEKMRSDLFGDSKTARAVTDFQEDCADKAGIPRAPAPVGGGPDYWTSVCVSVASSYSSDSNTTDAMAFTVDASVNYGLLSAAVSVSHSESHANAVKQMANASVKISFDCMRVDITRPWLRGELFYDHDLRIPENEQYVFRGKYCPAQHWSNMRRSFAVSAQVPSSFSSCWTPPTPTLTRRTVSWRRRNTISSRCTPPASSLPLPFPTQSY